MWVLLSQVVSKGMAEAKMAALEDVRVLLVRIPAEFGSTMKQP